MQGGIACSDSGSRPRVASRLASKDVAGARVAFPADARTTLTDDYLDDSMPQGTVIVEPYLAEGAGQYATYATPHNPFVDGGLPALTQLSPVNETPAG